MGRLLLLQNFTHHHSVPCFIAFATMDLHLSRFQVHEIVCVGLSFCSHTVILSSIFSLCLPLLLCPSIFPVVTICSNSFLLITCPKNTACLFLASLTNDLIVPAFSSTSSFLILSTYEILSILRLRRNHISVAFNLFSISLIQGARGQFSTKL